jgi:hypothetical protein
MKDKVSIGRVGRESFLVDLGLLIRTRLFIHANSGGGKSWLIRVLCEKLFGKVQIIIIDRWGEFATLREKYAFLLVAKEGGDLPADLTSAAKLGKTIREKRISAICDLYDLKQPGEREDWVGKFVWALLDCDKKFWKPCVVIVDEAHFFCPQKEKKARGRRGQEDEGPSSRSAIIELSTGGRKQGFCAILASQRISKVDKDAMADLLNMMIGPTVYHSDRDRAAEELGIRKKEREDFDEKLKRAEPGEFFCFGRALGKDITPVKISGTKTTHIDASSGQHFTNPPPAPKKIKRLLRALKDLPQQAVKEAKTIKDFQGQIRTLQAQVRNFERQPKRDPDWEKRVIEDRDRYWGQREIEWNQRFDLLSVELAGKKGVLASIAGSLTQFAEKFRKEAMTGVATTVRVPKPAEPKRFKVTPNERPGAILPFRITPRVFPTTEDVKLKPGARRMLESLCRWYPEGLTEGQLATQAGMKRSSGTYSSYKSNLRTAGVMAERDGRVFATEHGMTLIGQVEGAPHTTAEVLAIWKPKLKPGAWRLFEVIFRAQGEPISIEDLCREAGFQKSGTLSSYLSNLRTAQLIVARGRGFVAANRETLLI